MRAKDLMIGDWVAFQGHPYQYTASDIASMAECEDKGIPTDTTEIPLTEEVLEKNGIRFRFQDGEPWYRGFHYLTGFEVHFSDDCLIKLHYVHELQHALRLLGFDKEIVLK